MAIKIVKQEEPANDANRCQFYEDTVDGHPKVKNSSGIVVDLQAAAEGGIFGTRYSFVSDNTASSTGSNTYQTALTLTTPVLPEGNYNVTFFYNWGYNSTGRDFMGQLIVDDTTVIMEHRQEPKDPGTDQRHVASGNIPITLTAGVHTIKLQYKCQNSGDNARIRNKSIQIWRTS